MGKISQQKKYASSPKNGTKNDNLPQVLKSSIHTPQLMHVSWCPLTHGDNQLIAPRISLNIASQEGVNGDGNGNEKAKQSMVKGEGESQMQEQKGKKKSKHKITQYKWGGGKSKLLFLASVNED